MSNKFDVELGGKDKLTEMVERVNSTFKKLNKTMFVQKKAGEDAATKSPMTRYLDQVAKSSLLVSKNMGMVLPPFQALTGAGSIAGITALAVGAERFAKAWGEAGYKLKNLSLNSNLSVADSQLFLRAGKLAHVEEEAMSSSMMGLYKSIVDARTGNPSALTALKTFGVDPQTADTKSAFMKIADGISSGRIDVVRQQESMAMLGLEEALPLLRRGSAGINSLMREGRGYGGVKTSSDVTTAQNASDWLTRKKMSFMGAYGQVENNVLDAFVNGTSFTDFAKKLGRPMAKPFPYRQQPLPIQPKSVNPQKAPSTKATLGVRNNNPWNLKSWEGFPTYTSLDGKQSYAIFPDFPTGMQKADVQLRKYGKRGIDTISGIVSTASPSSENNTEKYIRDLALETKLDPNEHLNLEDTKVRSRLLSGITKLEGSGSYTPDQVAELIAQAQAKPIQIDINLTGAPAGTIAQARDRNTGALIPARVSNTAPHSGP